MKISRIITNKNVDKDFEGNECRLIRSIIKSEIIGGSKYYHIKTERCKFVKEIKINTPKIFNGFDDLSVESTNNITPLEDEIILKIISQKDNIQVRQIKKEEYNIIYSGIKLNTQSTLDSDLWNFEKELEELALLSMTRNSSIFHTFSNDWVIYDPENLDNLNIVI